MKRGGWLTLLFVALCLSFVHSGPEDPLSRRVIIVPHSLCPSGYRETPEDYQPKVDQILNNIVTELDENDSYKFLWSETSYFEKWWKKQPDSTKDTVSRLVLSDRFEFASGGFVQHDQAVSTWSSLINQMALGHEFIFRTFGRYPKYGWQVDSFGSSSATPLFFSKFNMRAIVLSKVPSSARDELKKGKSMEFMWSFGGDPENPEDYQGIFTHVSHEEHLLPPDKLQLSLHLLDEAMTESTLRNTAHRVLEYALEATKYYPNGDLLLPWGGPFTALNARNFLGNIEQLLGHLNGKSNLEFSFGTLADYFEKTIKVDKIFSNSTRMKEYNRYVGDFLPFTETGNEGYAGFYTSRPGLKKLTRQAESSLRSAEGMLSLYAADVLKQSYVPYFNSTQNLTLLHDKAIDARKQLAILQGNYAVTGTAPNISVVDDFFNRITNVTIANANSIMAALAENYLRKNGTSGVEDEADNRTAVTTDPPVPTNHNRQMAKTLSQKKNKTLSALSSLPNILTTGKSWPLVLYNSLPFIRNEVFRLKVETVHVTVEDYEGNPIEAQVSEKIAITRTHEVIIIMKFAAFSFETIFVTVWPTADSIPSQLRNCTATLPITNEFRLHSNGVENMDQIKLENSKYRMSQFSITDEFKMLATLETLNDKSKTRFMHQMLDSDSPSYTGMFQTAHSNIRRRSPWLWLPIYLIYFASLVGTRLLRKSLCGISFMSQSGLSTWKRKKSKGKEHVNLNLVDEEPIKILKKRHEHDSDLDEKTLEEGSSSLNYLSDSNLEKQILRQQMAYENAVEESKPYNRFKKFIVLENKPGFGILLICGAIFSTVLIIAFKVTLSALGTLMGLVLAAIIGSTMGASQRLVPGVAFGIGFGIGMIFGLYNLLFDYAVPVDIMVWSYCDGPLMSQATMIYAGYTSVAIRLFKAEGIVGQVFEISYAVSVDVNHQLMTRQSAEMDTKTWWSDNGLEMINRSRSVFDISSRTYYPVVNTAFTREKDQQWTVLTKQTMGITSRAGGVIELMLHRQTNESDNFGLSQDHLLDASHVEIINWHLYSNIQHSESIRHRLSLMLNHPVCILAGERVLNRTSWTGKFHRSRTLGKNVDTENDVELLDLQMRNPQQLVMRWQNLNNVTRTVNANGILDGSSYTFSVVRPNFDLVENSPLQLPQFNLRPLETATFLVHLSQSEKRRITRIV